MEGQVNTPRGAEGERTPGSAARAGALPLVPSPCVEGVVELPGSGDAPRVAAAARAPWKAVAIPVAAAVLATALIAGLAVLATSSQSAWSGTSRTTTTGASGRDGEVIRNLPAQAAALVFGDANQALAYAHPGGLVVAGRDNYAEQPFKDVSAAGGTVLIYFDAVIDARYGRYHEMLDDASACGPATSRWPGNYKANDWGYLNDFRRGSVLQTKLECVLETMVADNPHMGGWFADDLGSRSWFPGVDWDSFPDKAGYREGAIALTQTMRRVADRHHLIFLVNGTWAGGSLATAGGGYPNLNKSGTSLADGGVVEHHDGAISYFGPYGCSSQWADDSAVTHGKAFNYAVTSTPAGTWEYAASSCFAFVNDQDDYGRSEVWGTFHTTGLPARAR